MHLVLIEKNFFFISQQITLKINFENMHSNFQQKTSLTVFRKTSDYEYNYYIYFFFLSLRKISPQLILKYFPI